MSNFPYCISALEQACSGILNSRFNYLLSRFAEEYKVELKEKNISDRFDELVRKISAKRKKDLSCRDRIQPG